MLARSIFENEFYLYRLARDDGSAFAREMQAEEAYHHRRLGKAIEVTGGEGRSRVQEIINWSLEKNIHFGGNPWPIRDNQAWAPPAMQ